MGLILNGNAPNKMLYNGAEVSLYFNGSKIWPETIDYNPLGLPDNTVRVRTNDGNPPKNDSPTDPASYTTATLVTGTNDTYDVYKAGTDFTSLLSYSTNVISILGANTSNITNMDNMLYNCWNLTSIPLFDMRNVTSMSMFAYYCSKLENIPNFDVDKITNMYCAFISCYRVKTGILSLYQRASTQTNPPSNHYGTFRNCGRDTTQGAAELAQIPSDWK